MSTHKTKTTYTYKTYFDDQYRPFYIYYKSVKPKSRPLGCIPAGIDVIYKGKTLSTIDIMQHIHTLWTKNTWPKHLLVYDHNDWYKNNKLNKPLLYQLAKELESFMGNQVSP